MLTFTNRLWPVHLSPFMMRFQGDVKFKVIYLYNWGEQTLWKGTYEQIKKNKDWPKTFRSLYVLNCIIHKEYVEVWVEKDE